MNLLARDAAHRADRFRWCARLIAAWALAAFAWGLNLLDPAEGHTVEVLAHLPYILLVVVIATFAGFWGLEGERREQVRSALPYLAPSITSILALFFIVTFSGWRHWMMGLCALTLLLLHCSSVFNRWISGLHSLVATLLLGSLLVVIPWYLPLFVQYVLALVGPIVVSLLSKLGQQYVNFDGALIFAQGRYVLVDAIKSAFPFALLLALANILFLILLERREGGAQLLKRAAIIFGLFLILMSTVLLHYVVNEEAKVFAIAETSVRLCWTTPLLAGLIGQFLLLLYLWHEPARGRIRLFLPRVLNSLSVAKFCMASALFTAAVFFHFCYGVYQPRPLKIIVDEIHCRWEPFYGDYGRIDYDPTLSENNYRSFLRWLSRYWDVELVLAAEQEIPQNLEAGVTVSKRKSIGDWLLNGDVTSKALIIKCVTKPYAKEEIDIIESFVRQGGNLFIVGEHTDVLFMNTHLNPLAERFGMTFPPDSIYNLDGDWCVSTRYDMANHPCAHFLDDFYWANGCTIRLKSPARPLIQSPWSSFTEPANYYVENFFGNKIIDRHDEMGRKVIAATARKGLGRVFAWTDSTCFNNYLFFTYGRRRLVKGVLGWFALKGSATPTFLTIIFVLAALFLLSKTSSFGNVFWSLAVILPPALAIGLLLANVVNEKTMIEPAVKRALPQKTIIDGAHDPRPAVVFEGRVRWEAGVVSLLPMFGDLARLPWFPEVHRHGPITEEVLKNCRLLVVAGSRKSFSVKEIETINRFVQEGGGLLLIEGAEAKGAINGLAQSFGLEFATGRFNFAQDTTLLNPAIVSGGKPLVTVNGKAVVSYVRSGAGLVLAFGDDHYFASEHENRGHLGLGQLYHDIAKNLALAKEDELNKLPLAATLLDGHPYR